MLKHIPLAFIALLSGRVAAQSWGAWDDASDTVTETVTNTLYTCPCDGSETTVWSGHETDAHGHTWSHIWSDTLTSTEAVSRLLLPLCFRLILPRSILTRPLPRLLGSPG